MHLPAIASLARYIPRSGALACFLVANVVSFGKAQEKGDLTVEAIDRQIADTWMAVGLAPSPAASEPEFLRRLYLDLNGRIPTVQEATSYLESKEAGRRLKLVERLLANPDYAHHFANVWTTVLVGRRPTERQVDREALLSWMRRQLERNRPWDEVSRELLTAKGSNEENGAVNFTIAHMENGAIPLTSQTTRIFLGQQIQCTQCHDHPSNDWKQEQFWGINAFYKGLSRRTIPRVNARGLQENGATELLVEPTEAYAKFEKRNGEIRIAFPMFLDGQKLDTETADRRMALGQWITARENPDFARAFVNRLWAHFLGRGFVHPVDDFGPHNPPSHPELLDAIAGDFRDSGFDMKALIRKITATRAYALSSQATAKNEQDDSLFSHMALKPMTPEQLFDSLLTATGADKAGGAGDGSRRERWLNRFVVTFANDEEAESSFQGTIPQALMMMNGELMANAVSVKPGGFLAKLIEQASRQRNPEEVILRQLYLATLTRLPTRDEIARLQKLPAGPGPAGRLAIFQDLYWSLLNSNEFILNH